MSAVARHLILLLALFHGAASLWTDFVDRVISALAAEAGSIADEEWAPEPAHCKESQPLNKLRHSLHFFVSDWLTAAPSRVPDAGHTAAQHGEQVAGTVEEAYDLADTGILLKAECDEAHIALVLFHVVLSGDATLNPGFPGQPRLSWRRVVVSEWPMLGLAAQVLRLEAQALPGLSRGLGSGRCARFLGAIPEAPFAPEPLLHAAVEHLDSGLLAASSSDCALASALALAVLVQGAPAAQATAAAGFVASLLDKAETSPRTASLRAALFFLLDRAFACASRVEVRSGAGRHFVMHLPSHREHVADRIRLFRNSHCGVEHHTGLHLEEEALVLARARPDTARVLVEVGPGLGGCFLPLLLLAPPWHFARAVAFEPARPVAELLARAVEGLPASSSSAEVHIVPELVTVDASPGEARAMSYDLGHITAPLDAAAPAALPAEMPGRGASALPAAVQERVPVSSLHEALRLLGIGHVDLLLLYPEPLCAAIEANTLPLVSCQRRLGRRAFGHCAFVGCAVTGPAASGVEG
mmetsp:Transcript_3383/g.11356  ORF Transcript_3383/g.11356 Transcript_3383/m.11356 type:complete len:527 (-) Transcript_3383:550-2130(-)